MTLVNSLVMVEKGNVENTRSKSDVVEEHLEDLVTLALKAELAKALKVDPNLDVASFTMGFIAGWKMGLEQAVFMTQNL